MSKTTAPATDKPDSTPQSQPLPVMSVTESYYRGYVDAMGDITYLAMIAFLVYLLVRVLREPN